MGRGPIGVYPALTCKPENAAGKLIQWQPSSLKNKKGPGGSSCKSSQLLLSCVRRFVACPQNLPHPRPRRNLPRTSSSLLKPFMESAEFHAVLDRRISSQDANREVLADIFDPTALANGADAERNRFVEGFGGHLCRVLDAFCIADGDAA